jgi:hypothetical protein
LQPARPARGDGALPLLAWPLAVAAICLPLLYAVCLGGDSGGARRADVAEENRASTAFFRWSNAGRVYIVRSPAGRPSLELRVPPCEWAAFTPAERSAVGRHLAFAAVRGASIEWYVIRDDAGAVLATGKPNP